MNLKSFTSREQWKLHLLGFQQWFWNSLVRCTYLYTWFTGWHALRCPYQNPCSLEDQNSFPLQLRAPSAESHRVPSPGRPELWITKTWAQVGLSLIAERSSLGCKKALQDTASCKVHQPNRARKGSRCVLQQKHRCGGRREAPGSWWVIVLPAGHPRQLQVSCLVCFPTNWTSRLGLQEGPHC